MTRLTRIFSFFTIGFSILMSASLFVHGMQLEKTTHKTSSLALPAALATYKAIEGAAQFTDAAEHTHVERTSLSDALQHLRQPATSKMLAREDSRKHILSKKVVKGTQPFDGYHIPDDRA